MNKVLKKESGSVKLYRLCSIDVMNLDIIVNRNLKATDTKRRGPALRECAKCPQIFPFKSNRIAIITRRAAHRSPRRSYRNKVKVVAR
jgi:hypothetical protein